MCVVNMLAIFLLFFGGFLNLCLCDYEAEVELKQGRVKGHLGTSYKGRHFLAFEGIPYAKPPVGNLRFAPPEAAEKWEGVLEGNKLYSCAQLLPIPYIWGPSGTEDCLYLYVYVPRETIDKSSNLPVVVHIHGGAFMLGSPKMMALPDYIMDQDVIYVTLNYRVGILGFLSTEDSVVPGNMGLKDQSLALKWIKDNINEFGGNSDSVTITGLSAGAASVHYHYLSPMSKGLFSRGISHSGTALQSWALTKNPLQKAVFVAKNVSCDTHTTEKMISCMRSKSHKELITAIDGLFVLISALPCTPFGPVIEQSGDNAFILEHPYKLLKEGKVYDVPWINSNVQDEGIFPVGFFFRQGNTDKFMNQKMENGHFMRVWKMEYIADKWDTVMPTAFDMNDTVDDSLKKEVVNKIKTFYYGNQPVTANNGKILVKAFSDRLFFIDSELATRTHVTAVTSPVYVYFYKFLPESNFSFRNMKPGVSHGLDGKLLYKWILFTKLKQREEKIMFILTNFLAQYAKTGIPQVNGVKWDPVEPDKKEINYLEINSPDDMQMKKVEKLGPKDFWDSLPIKENNHIY